MEYTLYGFQVTIISFNPYTTHAGCKDANFFLTMRETLVKGEQLTDEHIHLAQRLLKKHFHHIDGLQPSVLSKTNGFTPVQHKAIQIHHVPAHWVTSSSIGGNLAVYDSKFTGGDLSSSLIPL